MKIPSFPILLLPKKLACRTSGSVSGVDVGTVAIFHWTIGHVPGDRPAIPPSEQSHVKAVACEAVAQTGVPLSRQSTQDVTRRVHAVLSRPISRSTVWRILDRSAIKPWQYRYWIFPRDPNF